MQQFKMIINGKTEQSTDYFAVIDPATGETFAQCQSGSVATVDKAVEAARIAYLNWSQTSNDERIAAIHAIGAAIEKNMPELMKLVTQETGKPLNGLNGIGSGMEVGASIAWTHYNADLQLPIEVIQDNDEARVEVHRKSLGVVASITPWNWPLMIAIWHIMPALRVGNTVVIKPSPTTPLSTIRLVELVNEILPAGVLNIVTGGPEVGEAISNHRDINKIIFTGSTPTGKAIMKSAATNLKRITLELGGNDAGIVLADVDVQKIADKIFTASFHNNGQTCACLKRLYVHESVYEELTRELVRLAKNVVVGNGLEETVELGPLQNLRQLEIVDGLALDARANGGEVLCGGQRLSGKGFFYQPTIVTGLTDGSRLVDEEQFGPILPIIKFSNVDDVIAISNKNESGLGGSVWSNDIDLANQIALKMECGSVWINDHGAIQPDAPFGGVKQSGIGVEFGVYGLEEYTSIQTIKISK